MEKGLISIVVPVYNVEKYLVQCLDSILGQTYHNWELILVDDGSYDKSYKICCEYATKDERIKLLSQNNQGVSKARNVGLALAKGEYVTFIDSDDFVKKDYLEKLYQALIANQADIAIGDYYHLDERAGLFIYFNPKSDYGVRKLTKNEVLQKAIQDRFVMATGKLYKRKLFEHVFFKSGYFEDREMIARLYILADKFVMVTDDLYCYRQRMGSTVSEELSFKKMADLIKATDSMLLTYALAKLDDKPVRDSLLYFLKLYQQLLLDKGLTQTDLYKEIMWHLDIIKE